MKVSFSEDLILSGVGSLFALSIYHCHGPFSIFVCRPDMALEMLTNTRLDGDFSHMNTEVLDQGHFLHRPQARKQ